MVVFSRAIFIQAIASMLLLTSCGGGGSSDENASNDDDCTPTTNLSTSLQLSVDFYGNISTNPIANNSVSGCASSSNSESDGTIELKNQLFTRFKSSDDFNVWECDTGAGARFYYALFEEHRGSTYRHLGLEIGPVESSFPDSQLIFWEAKKFENALLISTSERGSENEWEWTDINFPTDDTMSVNSTIRGALQCTRKTNGNNGESFFGFDVVLTSLATGSDGSVELTSRLETAYKTAEKQEFWYCLAENGSRLGFTFYDYEYPKTPPRDGSEFSYYKYGIEFDSGIDYYWSIENFDSLVRVLKTQRTKDEWTHIRFPTKRNMVARSTFYGVLSCQLEQVSLNMDN